jgi:hypothetical protein
MIGPMMDAKDKTDLNQFPRRSLKDCLRLGKLLLEKISNTQVDQHVAIGAIGYSTMNGAAMSALGALRHYGLIEGPRGKGVCATAALVKASRSDDQALLTELAFRPAVFRQLKEGGFETCTDDVLMKHLEGRGLSARAARDAVKIFRANAAFLVDASDSPASGQHCRRRHLRRQVHRGRRLLRPSSSPPTLSRWPDAMPAWCFPVPSWGRRIWRF